MPKDGISIFFKKLFLVVFRRSLQDVLNVFFFELPPQPLGLKMLLKSTLALGLINFLLTYDTCPKLKSKKRINDISVLT